MPYQILATVAIFVRDAVAGHALELLLQDAGYETRFVAETANGNLAEALDGVQLLLLAPALAANAASIS